jgi:hypothetical protein
MEAPVPALPYTLAIAGSMIVLLEVGRRLGARRVARHSDASEASLGAGEGAVFALFGLLLAFTFAGAGARFDARRQLVAEEANAVGTAWLRLDLLPAEAQPPLRALFREYLDTRLEVYRRLPDVAAAEKALAESEIKQRAIWKQAVPATLGPGAHPDAGKLLLPALNEMIDITTTRTMAARIHAPRPIWALLFLLALGCALLAGYSMGARKKRNWLHIAGFVGASVVVIYVILDLEYPRVGFFRIDAYDQVLIDLAASMR